MLASYGVVAFLFNLLDEVRPIFASAPIEDGGLALPTDVLSWPLSFGGLSFILFVCLGKAPVLCGAFLFVCCTHIHKKGGHMNMSRHAVDSEIP